MRFRRTLPTMTAAPVAAIGNLVLLLVFLFAVLPSVPADAPRLRVRVDAGGAIVAAGRAMSGPELSRLVAQMVRDDPRVRVEADLERGISVARIREVLELLRPAAVIDIVFTATAVGEPAQP